MVPGRRKKKSPIPHGGNPKTALSPTSDEGCFESFTKDQWIKNLGLDLLTKKNIWKKNNKFHPNLSTRRCRGWEDPLFKKKLFSLGRTKTQPQASHWKLENFSITLHQSRECCRSYWEGFSNHLQPFPTNTWFVELQPILGNSEIFVQISSAWMFPPKKEGILKFSWLKVFWWYQIFQVFIDLIDFVWKGLKRFLFGVTLIFF